jgi:hypothetical protein
VENSSPETMQLANPWLIRSGKAAKTARERVRIFRWLEVFSSSPRTICTNRPAVLSDYIFVANMPGKRVACGF